MTDSNAAPALVPPAESAFWLPPTQWEIIQIQDDPRLAPLPIAWQYFAEFDRFVGDLGLWITFGPYYTKGEAEADAADLRAEDPDGLYFVRQAGVDVPVDDLPGDL
jgi:hypothetical protein